MSSIKRYKGWALITGASSGIGAEFAKRLASENINLVIVARRAEKLKLLADQLRADYNITCKVIVADLSKKESYDRVINETENIEVGILINNAGFGMPGCFINSELASNLEMINLHCSTVAALSHHFGNLMAKRENGAIIIISSVLGFYPVPSAAIYSSTKAFDLNFGAALAFELKKHSVDVLTVAPGATDTEFKRLSSGSVLLRTTEDVVNKSLSALGNKSLIVDGFFNKVLVIISKLLPRISFVKFVGKYFK